MGLGSLSFVSPWLLVALVVLPALWWLLKITPPMAQKLPFPALRLLIGLAAEEETPARTPLWLAILRLILASAIVLALAHPLLGSGLRFERSGPVLLVVDDGYAAAPDWPKRQAVMQEILSAAERESRPVAVLTTAPPESGEAAAAPQPLSASEARKLVQALVPKPWPADRAAASKALAAALESKDGDVMRKAANVVWICDGIDDHDGAAKTFARQLAGLGGLRVLTSGGTGFPHLVLPPATENGHFTAKALRPAGTDAPAEAVSLVASDESGHVLAEQTLNFTAGAPRAEALVDLPVEIANGISRLEVAEEPGAASVFLLDERWRRRTVGLVSVTPQESDRPLLGDLYYLKRALIPFSEVRIGVLNDLLKSEPSVLALPDAVVLSPKDRDALADWIAKGGVLVRFAGPHMAESADLASGTPAAELIPVALRRGGRALGGVMSWTAPMALAPFDAASPFAGLVIPGDVTVERQVLAEPALDLGSRTWAQLADGTPLVTGERRGEGTLVLFHITANADWSNLPLSGLFVEMLKRVVALSHGAAGKSGASPLSPYRSLDGFGRLGAPPAAAIAFDPGKPPEIGPKHPPGYYGTESARLAVNLGSEIAALVPVTDFPAGTILATLAPVPVFDLKPWLWLAAFLLTLADVVISLWLRGLLPRFNRRAAAAAAILLAAFLASLPARAETDAANGDDAVIAATSATRLAYVRTGDASLDEESAAGMRGLTRVVDRRTAAELADPMAVDIERDEILFFPILYWPVSADQKPPSAAAAAKLNQYLATGGIILFDTGDAKLGLGDDRRGGFGWNGPGASNLRRIVGGLRIPPLVPLPADHVLTRSYYLMQEFPGRFAGGSLWVAGEEGQGNDGVSPVVIGGNDWAAAWALDQDSKPMYPVVPGGGMQREQAFRFGINLVMYALTGNYKADQVHVPAILERLGQ